MLFKARPVMFGDSPVGFILCLILIVGAGLGLLLLLIWWLRCVSIHLEVTNRRVILRHGILAKHTTEVRHVDVRNISVYQGFLQRLCGVGRIDVASAGHAGVEISVSGIPHPNKAADIIRRHQA